MKKLMCMLLILGLCGMASAAWNSTLGDLPHVMHPFHGEDAEKIYINDVGNCVDCRIYFLVPYPGNYTFQMESDTPLLIQELDSDGSWISVGSTQPGTVQLYLPYLVFSLDSDFVSYVNRSSTITLTTGEARLNFSNAENQRLLYMSPNMYGMSQHSYQIEYENYPYQTVFPMSEKTYNDTSNITNTELVDMRDVCIDTNDTNATMTIYSWNMSDFSQYFEASFPIFWENYNPEYDAAIENPNPNPDFTVLTPGDENLKFSYNISHPEYLQTTESRSVVWLWDRIPIGWDMPSHLSITPDALCDTNCSEENINITDGYHQLEACPVFSCTGFSIFSSACVVWNIYINRHLGKVAQFAGYAKNDQTLARIPNADISVYTENGMIVGTTHTNSEGFYLTDFFSRGKYTLKAHASGYRDMSWEVNTSQYPQNQDVIHHNFYMFENLRNIHAIFFFNDYYAVEDSEIYNFSIKFDSLDTSDVDLFVENLVEIYRYGCNYSIAGNWISIENITAGKYHVEAYAPGYTTTEGDVEIYVDDQYIPIYLTNISGIRRWNLTGNISFEGDFLDRIPIYLYSLENSTVVNSTMSNLGNFSFVNVPQGSYYLRVITSPYAEYIGDPIYLTKNIGYEILLERKTNWYTFSGFVHPCGRKYENIPLEGVVLRIYNSSVSAHDVSENQSAAYVITDEDGKFSIMLPESGYFVDFQKAGWHISLEKMYYPFRFYGEDYADDFCMSPTEVHRLLTVWVQNDTSDPVLNSSGIDGARVDLKQNGVIQKQHYTAYGMDVFYVVEGIYSVCASHPAYFQKCERVDLFSDQTITIVLDRRPGGAGGGEGGGVDDTDLWDVVHDDIGLPASESEMEAWFSTWGWVSFSMIFFLFIGLILFRLIFRVESGGRR